MKILCFIESLALGGAEKTAVRLADEWVGMGHEVHIATTQYIMAVRPAAPAVRLYNLDGERGSALGALPGALSLAKELQPDVLVGHMPKGVLLALVARLGVPKARVLGVEHSVPSYHYRGLKKFLVKALMGRAYPRTDGIVAVSQGAAANLRAWGVPAAKVHAHGNPIPVAALYKSAKAGGSLRRHPHLPGLVAVGRLVALKGYDDLIRAAALLKQQGRPVELVILGDGPERQALEALATELGVADTVLLAGMVSTPESTVMDSDLLVCASHYEGFGNVLVEALSVGTGAVSTDCPCGPREILRDPARLAKPGDPADLANVIARQLEALDAMSPKERASLKKALRTEAASRFDATLVAYRYLHAAGAA